jgi:alkylation response protein AidB-like acyl-CoA dehydrogenase
MQLTYSDKHLALQRGPGLHRQARTPSPKPGGGRQKPAQGAGVAEPLLEHGLFARNVPKAYGGFACPRRLELAVIAEEISKPTSIPAS